MNIKLSSFALDNYYKNITIKHGMKVCPSNGCSSVGTIVDIGPLDKESYTNRKLPRDVTVLWGSPKRKRGKKTVHSLDTLVDLAQYKAEIKEELKHIEDLEAEANSLGL